MSILLKLSKGNYAGPNDQSKDFESETLLDTHNPNVIAVRYRTAAISLFLAVMVGAMGFWLGQNTCQPRDPLIQDWLTEKTDNFHSVEPFFRTFTYNGTFASAPSKETNLAWDSLFPDGKGFIKDPAGHLEMVGVSVFHQLHCLDLLRHLYYEAEPRTGAQELVNEARQNAHHHAKHCFDYLRQALICAADSTVEPGNATTNLEKLVTGGRPQIMASLIETSPAMEEDFPILAHIAAVAMSVDLVHRIIYEGNNPLDTSRQERSVVAELHRAASNPEAHICKAVLKSSKEIVGYSLFRFEDDSKPSALPVKPPTTIFPAGTNARFLERMTSGVRAVHKEHMAGKRHVWWTHLMVLPGFQRIGIGSALFRHGFENLGADEVPIWIVTQMRGRSMYLKFGFQDLDVIDVDLSEYAGPWQGFGIHRNICMLRQPGGGANSGLQPEPLGDTMLK